MTNKPTNRPSNLNRRSMLLGTTVAAAAAATAMTTRVQDAAAQAAARVEASTGKKPNIVIIWGDDVGLANISAYSFGLMGFRTPNIDRVAREGVMFTDYYAEQS